MSQIDKLIARFKSVPSDFTYAELTKLLNHFGFIENNKGMTSGSRVAYIRYSDSAKIMFHKPHGGSPISQATLKKTMIYLEGYGNL